MIMMMMVIMMMKMEQHKEEEGNEKGKKMKSLSFVGLDMHIGSQISDLEVFIAPNKNPNLWFRCLKPNEGDRCDLSGKKVPKSEILVKVKKVRQVSNRNCQQLDYWHRWNLNKIESPENLDISKNFISNIIELIPKKIKIYIKAKSEFYLKSFVWWKSEYLIRENVKDLIK